jgi:DNA-binding transcriptional ArsR family regulator
MSTDSCDEFFVDSDKVESVKSQLKSEDTFHQLADTFKVLGDPTRVKILYALGLEELCVCDISTLLGISQSATSHQLRILRNLRLVKYHREGRIVFYSLDDDHIRTLFNEGLKHVEE